MWPVAFSCRRVLRASCIFVIERASWAHGFRGSFFQAYCLRLHGVYSCTVMCPRLSGVLMVSFRGLGKSRNLFSILAYCEPLLAGLAPKGPKDPIIRYLGFGKELCRFLFGRVYDYWVLGPLGCKA